MNKKDKALLIFLGFLVIVALIGGQWWNQKKEFTTEKWTNYADNSRQYMVKNFLDRTVVNGMSEEDMIGYLGQPEIAQEDFFAYYLGRPIGLFASKESEEEYLVFLYDGKVLTGAEIQPASAIKTQ